MSYVLQAVEIRLEEALDNLKEAVEFYLDNAITLGIIKDVDTALLIRLLRLLMPRARHAVLKYGASVWRVNELTIITSPLNIP